MNNEEQDFHTCREERKTHEANATPVEVAVVDRKHSACRCTIIAFSLSLCITCDILQYSMPLAFLPSVLEDRGHTPMKIATAIGVYYWTGFAGGALVTLYQVSCLLRGIGHEEHTTLARAKQMILYLIGGLTLGSSTLVAQAVYPHLIMHIACRFVQGFAGAFIFFYSFLLSVELFDDDEGQERICGACMGMGQRTFAVTSASIALNIAEVLGSTMGAIFYDMWGQRSVFWFLGVVSVLNQLLLVGVYFAMRPGKYTPRALITMTPKAGCDRLITVLKGFKIQCAVILIVMSAAIKGSVEEMLPFHADHEWNYDPTMIGELFAIIAFAYICTAVVAGYIWQFLSALQIPFCAFWLALLGMSAWIVFRIPAYSRDELVLFLSLIAYGCCLGLTHTPAALLLKDAIEGEKGKAKESLNGIWNTMWEAGGSLGFLLGGLLADNHAHQIDLLTGYVACSLLCAGLMISIGNTARLRSRDCMAGCDVDFTSVFRPDPEKHEVPKIVRSDTEISYGSLALTNVSVSR